MSNSNDTLVSNAHDFTANIQVGAYDEFGNYGTFNEEQTLTIQFTETENSATPDRLRFKTDPMPKKNASITLHKKVTGTIEAFEITLDDYEQNAEFSMVATPIKPKSKFQLRLEEMQRKANGQNETTISTSETIPVSLELRILSSRLSYGRIIRDIICRLLILQLFNLGMINLTWFWILQLFYEFIFFLPNRWSNHRKHEKLKRYVERKTHILDDSVLKDILKKTRLKPKKVDPFIMLVFLILIILGQVSAFSVLDILSVKWRLPIMFMFLLPMQIIIANLLIGVMTQVPIINEEMDGLMEDDKNDVSIHKFSSTLLHIKQKIDTYTIESALLGALSLSAYLAILQNNLVNAASFKQCLQLLHELNIAFFNLNFTKASLLFGELFKNDILWHLIVLEGIIASVLYFLLIVARKKTHDQMKELELNLEISKAFNTKEEELINLNIEENNNKLLERKKEVSKITNDHIKKAYRLLPVLENSIKYMDLLRYAATSTFILLICTSCCIVLPTLGISILIIYLLSEIILKAYPKLLKYLKTEKEPIKKALLPFRDEGTWIWLKYFIYGFTAATVLVCVYGTLIPKSQIFEASSFLLPAILIVYLLIAILLILRGILVKPVDIEEDDQGALLFFRLILNLIYFGLLFLVLVGFGRFYQSFMTEFIYLSIFCFGCYTLLKPDKRKYLLQYTIQLFLFTSLVMVYFNISYSFYSTLLFSFVLLFMAVHFTVKKKDTTGNLDENEPRSKIFSFDFVTNPTHELNFTIIGFIVFYLVFLHF